MIKVTFYDEIEDSKIDFAVIVARTDGKWVFCKHKERETFEIPGGHREKGEAIDEAAKRELYEETGIDACPSQLIKIHQWIAPDKTQFIRVLFAVELESICETQPQDSDISACHWVSAQEILESQYLRSPLVAESLRCFLTGTHYPLDILAAYGEDYL